MLALTLGDASADGLRERVEDRLTVPYEELTVTTFAGLCARLLRDEALEAGIDPFATPVAAADRLAMLLERIDELPLRHHDLRGNPSGTLGSIVRRVDRLKDELISAADYAAWAGSLPDDARGAREREFAALFAAHDALLGEAGALDVGDLVLQAFRLLREKPHVRARLAARHQHVLIDELQDASFAQGLLLRLLVAEHGGISAFADDDQAIHRFRGAATKNIRDFRAEWPLATIVRLDESQRSGARLLAAAGAVVAPIEDRLEQGAGRVARRAGRRGRVLAMHVRARAGAGRGGRGRAVDLARGRGARGRLRARALGARGGPGRRGRVRGARGAVPPERGGGVLPARRGARPAGLAAAARQPGRRGRGRAGAGAAAGRAAGDRPRARDPDRAAAQARHGRGALSAALESPQIPPEARERIVIFLKLYRSAAAALDSSRPDLYVHRLVERLGLRRQLLFAATTEVVERLRNLARFAELAAAYVRRAPQATAREFARSIAAVADAGLREEEAAGAERARGVRVMTMHDAKGHEFEHVYVLGPDERADARSAAADARADPGRADQGGRPAALARRARRRDAAAAARGDVARAAGGSCSPTRSAPTAARRSSRRRSPRRRARPSAGEWEPREEELFGPAETLQSTFRLLRDELLTTVAQVGGRLGELRFDTDLDVSHAVVRYLELIKLARAAGAHAHRASCRSRRRCRRSTRGCCRPRPPSSARSSRPRALDDYLLDAERDERLRARAVAARNEPSLEPFLPRRGDGLLLSATDIETYRTCPLKYKFARVFRIPSEPTINQRFGILVHQVLERYHGGSGDARPARSCWGCWRPAGGAAASATPRRSASSGPRRRRRSSATTTASARRTASRSGSSARSSSGSARTCCAGAWTASTGCRTAATS